MIHSNAFWNAFLLKVWNAFVTSVISLLFLLAVALAVKVQCPIDAGTARQKMKLNEV